MFAKSYEQQRATDTAIMLILSGFLSNTHNCCDSAILAFCIGIIEKIMKKGNATLQLASKIYIDF
jgi:hypothetical protein